MVYYGGALKHLSGWFHVHLGSGVQVKVNRMMHTSAAISIDKQYTGRVEQHNAHNKIQSNINNWNKDR